MKNYSVLLPTLNEVGHIKLLIDDIKKNFVTKKIDYEILVIDDNSTDGTIEVVESISKLDPNIKIIVRKSKKRSLVASLNEGIKNANNNYIIWMDADFSHPPNYINEFIEKNILEDYDAIIFSRFLKNSERYYLLQNIKPKVIDKMSFVLNKICQNVISKNFTDYTSGFICIKKETISEINISGYYGDYFIDLIFELLKRKKKIRELPYIEKDRASGFSKTTTNKFNLLIKCYFYFIGILKCFFKGFSLFSLK